MMAEHRHKNNVGHDGIDVAGERILVRVCPRGRNVNMDGQAPVGDLVRVGRQTDEALKAAAVTGVRANLVR